MLVTPFPIGVAQRFHDRRFDRGIAETLIGLLNQINHVVMQKIGEPLHNDARTLSRLDCKMWHIKYSPDLYMFSMSRRFYKATQKEIGDAIDRQAVIESQKHSEKVLETMDNDFRRELGLTEEKKKFSPEDTHRVGLVEVYE